jgi:4-hydroxy-tetrahydrodipicolinate reductase
MSLKLVIAGAKGRMGQRIAALASKDQDIQLIYGLEALAKAEITSLLEANYPIGPDANQIAKADVVIDFTSAVGSMVGVRPKVEEYGKPYIIGTTGFNSDQEKMIEEMSRKIPIVKSSNMSPGVNAFFKAAQVIAKALPSYVVHIEETHHIHKMDSPSGTALQAGRLIEQAGGQKPVYDSKREGEVIGDHRITYKGPLDQIEIFHHAESRDIFAAGALQAAKWIVGRKPGLYTMFDVLGL